MLLPDLLIAHRITGRQRYLEFYHHVVDRFRHNPPRRGRSGPLTLERLARINHSSEGQAYEALYNLLRYESDPGLLQVYRPWLADLWEVNWMEGNSLFAYMTAALLPEHRVPVAPGAPRSAPAELPHGEEGLRLAKATLRRYPVDRVLRPVMNSLRDDLDRNPHARRQPESAKPLPIDERPLDNEYTWKGDPYQMDGWLKPTVTMFQSACDDPRIAWFSDSRGKIHMSRDGGASWRDVSGALMGARVRNFVASRQRTFVLHARTDRGVHISRDGGLSWRAAPEDARPPFAEPDFKKWLRIRDGLLLRIGDGGELQMSVDGGKTARPSMKGWRIPRATSLFSSPLGIVAGGPGGCYRSRDGEEWTELTLWRESETGAADFLHAYWLGRYYGFIGAEE